MTTTDDTERARSLGTRCRCGHPKYWHRAAVVQGGAFGRCEITGPLAADGCDCSSYDEAPDAG
jgi:hypothetical protein